MRICKIRLILVISDEEKYVQITDKAYIIAEGILVFKR